MKTIILFTLSALFLFSSCQKENSTPEAPKENTNYINVTSGSSWVYQEINSSGSSAVKSDYTVTATSRDTMISNKSYHIYSFSYGGFRYLSLSGKDYNEFDTLPGGGSKYFERLYLKSGASVGTTWSQSENLLVQGIQLPVKLNNTIVDNALVKEVNGKSYDKVIHVKTTITSDLIPSASLTTDINSYYAPNYGLIENTSKLNLNFLGTVEKIDLSTTLKSATLK
jgi:hypothetical protein